MTRLPFNPEYVFGSKYIGKSICSTREPFFLVSKEYFALFLAIPTSSSPQRKELGRNQVLLVREDAQGFPAEAYYGSPMAGEIMLVVPRITEGLEGYCKDGEISDPSFRAPIQLSRSEEAEE